eukprot:g4537.t1
MRRTSSRSKIGKGESKAEKWIRTAESSEMGIFGLPLPSPQQPGDSIVKSKQVCYHQAGPIIFTAPHSIRLKRDGDNDHRVEPLTKDLVKVLTVEFGFSKASSILWKNDAEQQYDTNRDPNYLKREELKSNPWHRFLTNHHQRHGAIAMHFDVHGMNGKKHGSDLALGYEPIHRFLKDASYQNLPLNLDKSLRMVLAGKGFTVKEVSTMTGYRSPSRLTLSQQSVEICKSAAIQMEMSMKLRIALIKDATFRKRFRDCFDMNVHVFEGATMKEMGRYHVPIEIEETKNWDQSLSEIGLEPKCSEVDEPGLEDAWSMYKMQHKCRIVEECLGQGELCP